MTEHSNRPDSTTTAELAETLKFFHDSGATSILHDTLLDDSELPKISPAKDKARKRAANNAGILHWVTEASDTACKCENLEELCIAIRGFAGCEIKKTALNTVFSDGNPNSKIMLIGEAPGSTEDREGRPFCGTSGMLLDKMFAAINLYRTTNMYISNSVFWRPPGNRKPTDFEIDVCRPFVEKHIALVNPDIVVMVGSTACTSVLKSHDSISRLRGRFHEYTNCFLTRNITAMAIFHPAYLLRQPAQKRLAWEDLKMLRSYIQEKQSAI
ncbi:uracil-DNA glycosylase [Anaplasma platys]|uniref:Type-4 uracil-DNA glycosylase n=1 Tax=Anaplasma platys TaxID=949 RepID=A0A858PZD6_9RICK|nr:uracil-DNA glycosylase [Anaplasma platys]QJC27965.1 uracil-DNA glycosylase [Anaplasma platys]